MKADNETCITAIQNLIWQSKHSSKYFCHKDQKEKNIAHKTNASQQSRRKVFKKLRLPVGVSTCFSVNGRCPKPCSTTWSSSIIMMSYCHLYEKQKTNLFTYQSNQTIRVKYKIMLRCLSITYQRMHTPYLHSSNDQDGLT